jgi:transposase
LSRHRIVSFFYTSLEPTQCAKEQVLGSYKNLLAVEDAFCQLKSYLEVRPVFHWRPDRVRNHVRLCFIAYWLCARLGNEWRAKGEKGEVQRLLRQLQAIRVGTLKIAGQDSKRLLTQIPPELNTLLGRLGLFLYSHNRPHGLRCSPKNIRLRILLRGEFF